MTETMTVIRAQSGDWRLTTRHASNEWTNLRLELLATDGSVFTPKRGRQWSRKRGFWLGWNGERLARCVDASKLQMDYTDLHDQLIDYLRKHVPKRTD